MSAARPYIPRIGERAPTAPRFPLSRRNRIRAWWRELDKVLLGLVISLMVIGSIAVAAASPASARRLSTAATSLNELRFLWYNLVFQVLGLATMLGISMLPRETARRGALLAGLGMIGLLFLVPIVGAEVNGAKRWIDFPIRFQPSEFLKPAFAVILAWILSWRARDPSLPVVPLTLALTGLVVVLLMLQPNLGDAILFVGAWLVMAMLAGMPMQKIGYAAASGIGALALAYAFYDNARHRIDSFLGGGTAFDQVDLANRTLMAGGWTGAGLWLGRRKMQLPEAHTDYIYSVIGEEFGLLVCALVVILYLAIVARILVRMLEEENLFTVLSAAGLATLFGGQAFINILVNLQLFPSKGMTLPLISYGGSSTIAQCCTVGLILAMTRRNPFLSRDGVGITAAVPKVMRK
ncbi:FtsW/RodA/SpoVE family cell cycle protein [Tsuneonella sp. HG222]